MKGLIEMKFTPEVIAALQVLKNNAENDFERHRISVLEQDLTEPPKVEIISDKYQKFVGVCYHKGKDGHFNAGASIHRDVWRYYNGEIPEGCVVHHKNENKSDNNIENLDCLTIGQHRQIHTQHFIPRPPKHKINCAYCGKEITIEKNKLYRFCSKKCSSLYRHHSGVYDEIRKCAYCGIDFRANKWAKTKFCSVACARKFSGSRITKQCPICGKIFEIKRSGKQKTCSKKCGAIFREQTMQRKKNQKPATRIQTQLSITSGTST